MSQTSLEAGWEALPSLGTGTDGAASFEVCVYGCPQQRGAADQAEAEAQAQKLGLAPHSTAPSHAQLHQMLLQTHRQTGKQIMHASCCGLIDGWR